MCSIFLVLVSFCLFGQAFSQDRKINAVLNPGCQALCPSSIVLIHVTAESEEDVIHHVWDFVGPPTVLVAHSPLNSTLSIDWKGFLDGGAGSVTFDPQPFYMFSTVIDKIIQFNEVNNTDKVEEENGSYTNIFYTKDLNWTLHEFHKSQEYYVDAVLEGRNPQDPVIKNGVVRLTMKAFGKKDHDEMLPHLFHTTNATEISLSLDDLSAPHETSTFSLGILTASHDPSDTSLVKSKHRSLDDEHSPGVFEVTELTTSKTKYLVDGGYLQWRAVAYTSSDRIMTNSTDIIAHDIHMASPEDFNHTVIHALYGEQLVNMSINTFNVSFGGLDDWNFLKTNYVSWTFLCGIGQPAEEEFSLLVMIVLCVSIGLPILIIIFGVFFFLLNRIARNRDDLVLSH